MADHDAYVRGEILPEAVNDGVQIEDAGGKVTKMRMRGGLVFQLAPETLNAPADITQRLRNVQYSQSTECHGMHAVPR